MAYVSGCAFSCKSPALVTSASSPGYYCSAPLAGAVCPDLCLRCACPPPDTTCSQPPADGAGLYWGSCVDVLGIRPMECDSSQLPPGAVFVGNAGRPSVALRVDPLSLCVSRLGACGRQACAWHT